MPMRCRTCGRSNRADAVFCDACGTRLDVRADEDRLSTALAPVPERGGIASPPPSNAERTSFRGEGVFVGRQHEMEALKAALEDALVGRGRLIMLVGELGIGKTRTAQELAIHAEGLGVQVLWGRCYETPGAPPFWPWIQVVRSSIRGGEPEALRAQMGGGASDIAEIVLDVREQLPDILPASPLADPEQARFRLFDSVTTFLQRAARRQPLLIVLDNLHWADRPSLLLLEFLAREIGESRLLVVGTYRDVEVSRHHPLFETLGELTRERLLQGIPMRGLGQEEVAHRIAVTTNMFAGMAFRAMLAIFEGRFEDGERLARQALALGQRLRGQNTLGVFGVQMFTLRREQGRLQELWPAVRGFAQRHPATSTRRPGLALIYRELRLEREAWAEFEALAANDFADIAQDALWPVCMAYLSEVCAFLRDGRRAATLYHFLLPYEGVISSLVR